MSEYLKSEYLVTCKNYDNHGYTLFSQETHCISGSALYEELYDLDIHTAEILDLNETTMFELERLVQNELRIHLKSNKWENIMVSWFPGETQTIPFISIEDTDYPDNYDGYTPIAVE